MKLRKPAYSIAELAELFDWSKPKVFRWLAENSIPTVRVGKKKVEVCIDELRGPNGSLLETAIALAETKRRVSRNRNDP